MEPNQIEAVHVTEESTSDYLDFKKKSKEHLPLGRVTGYPLEYLKHIFPEICDGQVGPFKVRSLYC